MMTMILLWVLLLLGIVWLILGIAYSYERWRSLYHQRISRDKSLCSVWKKHMSWLLRVGA